MATPSHSSATSEIESAPEIETSTSTDRPRSTLSESVSRSTVGTSSEADLEPHRLNLLTVLRCLKSESEAEYSTELPAIREALSTGPCNIR